MVNETIIMNMVGLDVKIWISEVIVPTQDPYFSTDYVFLPHHPSEPVLGRKFDSRIIEVHPNMSHFHTLPFSFFVFNCWMSRNPSKTISLVLMLAYLNRHVFFSFLNCFACCNMEFEMNIYESHT